MYKIFYWMMMIGYAGLTIKTPDIKGKLIGILLLLANGVIFWK